MARENQGLQIALIIFVMLTIILGVTTFLFFRQAQEGKREAADLQAKANDAAKREKELQDEYNLTKEMMGYPRESKQEAIKSDFVQQMAPYKALCPKKVDEGAGTADGVAIDLGDGQTTYLPSFSAVKAALTKQVADLQAQLAATTTDLVQTKATLAVREESKAPEIAGLTTARDAANKKAADEKAAFDKDRGRFTDDQKKFADDLAAARDEGAKQIAAKDEELKDKTATLEEVAKTLDRTKKDLSVIRDGAKKGPVQSHEFPGHITWVDERRGVVWINLGRADGLQPLTTFSVYPEKPTSVSQEAAKASIEVTAIRGDHEAEARILPGDTAKLADPIMPRDKIYSPVWSRGAKKHFALAGFMDIDGDGRSDLGIVRNLVTMNGGVVDMQIDDKGEQQGAISSETDYLVLGARPGDTAPKEAVDNYSNAIGAAKSNSVRQIKLDEFLQLMGWKQPTNVRRFGAGARPGDTAIKPSDNPPRMPGSGRDDRFKPRTPPPPGAAGAY